MNTLTAAVRWYDASITDYEILPGRFEPRHESAGTTLQMIKSTLNRLGLLITNPSN